MDALQRIVPLLVLVIALSSLIAAIALWRTAGETGQRACIEAANAKYPPVGVSAFLTRDRRDAGPIKLSYVRERQREVDRCD